MDIVDKVAADMCLDYMAVVGNLSVDKDFGHMDFAGKDSARRALADMAAFGIVFAESCFR